MLDILREIKKCNISYHELGKTDRSAMPIGNGELCASVWVNEKGEICFYISRSDALTELDRTVKLGMIQIAFSPNPFVNGNFSQTLDVAEGCIVFCGEGTKIWMCIDSETNQIILQGEFLKETKVETSFCTWRKEEMRFRGEFGYEGMHTESADIISEEKNGIWFYHKNKKNIIEETARVQEVEEAIGQMPDFLTDRIFGGYLIMEDSDIENGKLVKDVAKSFSIRVLTESIQGSETQFKNKILSWDIDKNTKCVKEKCKQFWNAYWENSYIMVKNDQPAEIYIKEEVLKEVEETQEYTVDVDSPITLAYVLTRFMMKCCQNGQFPILYNGMMFNLCPGKKRHFNSKSFGKTCTAVPGEFNGESNPDERPWCVEHLWQNIRHPYHTFLVQGEGDALKVLFAYYRRFWNLNRIRAKKYYSAEGQHNTEMTLSFGLQSIGIYGTDREGKAMGYAQNRYGGSVDISPGLELLSLMLDYYEYTRDTEFFKEEIQVYAKDLYRYVETRFLERENGKIVIEPLNSAETYWDTKNPTPVVSGLWSTMRRILDVENLDEENKKYFSEYQKQIPEIYSSNEDGELYLQPAEKFDEYRHNVEISELYACFPFNLYNQFSNNAELMKRTFHKRIDQYKENRYFIIGEDTYYPSYSGWQYYGVIAAQLGMTDMAQEILRHNVQLKNPGTRFPAMWGPIYDGVPDTDHGANIIHLLQKMVMQTQGEKIYLLPTFPVKWDVSFKLHPDKNTTVSAEYENGKLKNIEICPESAYERIVMKENVK